MVEIDLRKLSKEQIISLVESGAITGAPIRVHFERVVKPKRKYKRRTKVPYRQTKPTRTTRDVKVKLDKIRHELAKGKTLRAGDLNKIVGGDTTYLIQRYLRPSRWAQVSGGGRGHSFEVRPTGRTQADGFGARKKQLPTEGEYFAKKFIEKISKPKRKSSKGQRAYWQFRADRIKHYMEQGLPYKKASDLAHKDYKARKKGGDFPHFPSISSMYQPIVKAVIQHSINNGTPIDYRGVSYPLDLKSERDFGRFIDDTIAYQKQIFQSLGIKKGRFVWDGRKLRFKK